MNKTMIIADEAIKFMAKKAGMSAAALMTALETDPEGDAFSHFTKLLTIGLKEFAL